MNMNIRSPALTVTMGLSRTGFDIRRFCYPRVFYAKADRNFGIWMGSNIRIMYLLNGKKIGFVQPHRYNGQDTRTIRNGIAIALCLIYRPYTMF